MSRIIRFLFPNAKDLHLSACDLNEIIKGMEPTEQSMLSLPSVFARSVKDILEREQKAETKKSLHLVEKQ